MKLSFRRKKIQIADKKRVVVLLAVFAVALVFFNIILNYHKSGKATQMNQPTLPTVSMEELGISLNELHGYVNEMEAVYMRDAVIPLPESRKLPITINTYDNKINKISYEIRSLDTQRKIAETEISNTKEEKGTISTTVQIENLVDPGEEYLFILTLDCQGTPVYYYTRIMIPQECYEKECLDFAMNFHDNAIAHNYKDLSSYVETSEYANTKTLGEVTISSTANQIGWSGFDGTQVADPIVEIKDITPEYTAIVMYYQMQRKNSAGRTEYFNVEEYFKVRYTSERMYLLDYSRNTQQMLNHDHPVIDENEISLGIASSDMEYLSNETGTIVSFVQAGELYQYNQDTKELIRVFSFVGDNSTDARAYYNEHGIRILNIDESGTMDFVVYGYMNAGTHEGWCGVNLYHYDSDTKKATEAVFISSTKSYQILNAKFSDLLYETQKDIFYTMVGGTLVKVDLNTLDTDEVITGLGNRQYAASKSGRYLCWMDDKGMSDCIHVWDLETNEKKDIKAGDGKKIAPLAFMDEDFVYGIANDSDIQKDTAGTVVYPMREVKIVDLDGLEFSTLKEYQKEGCFITAAEHRGFTLYLTLERKEGTVYTPAGEDTIKNSAGEQNKAVTIAVSDSEIYGENTKIVMTDLPEGKTITSVACQDSGIVFENADKTIVVNTVDTEDQYFVYVGNKVILATDDLEEAIHSADEAMGIVVDNHQQYIWKRGKKAYQNAFTQISPNPLDENASSSAQCISAMLAREGESVEVHMMLSYGDRPIAILKNTLKDKTVVDLTGCTLKQVLYYVSQGNPVYAVTADQEAVLLVGYDAANVFVYSPQTGKISKVGLEDGTQMFADAGNVFISYIN